VTSNNDAIFVQDKWQPTTRLTFNLEFRAEKENVPSFAPGLPGIIFNWGSKPAPRLGVAYDLTGDGKTKVSAFYGWFYDRFKYELPRGSFGGDFYRRDFFDIIPGRGLVYTNYTYNNILGSHPDPIGGICPGTGAVVAGYGYGTCDVDFRIPSNSGLGIDVSGSVDPNIKAARQSEYTFGAERQMFRDWIFSARYTHKQVDHAVEDTGSINSTGSEAYIIGNPGEGLACQVYQADGYPCTKAQRTYNAFEIRADKRFSNHWFLNASYTYSRLYGNYSGLASSDEAGRTSPNVDRNFDLPYEPYTFGGKPNNGLLATDRPHVFKAYGGYDFDWNKTNTTEISFFTTAQSGTPLTTYANLFASIAIIVNGRGDLGRTPGVFSTDLNIDHKYRFGKDNRLVLQPFVNVLNLFNRQSEISVVNTDTAATVGSAILRAGGCPTAQCPNTLASIPLIFTRSGGVLDYFQNWLNANPSQQYNTYGLATGWTAPREVRFGARLYF
ncbi:MAG: hypothetical protein JO314_02600, partial [Acidobacteria bacterium]|nr:hypothetical protein [Acidobacteriota bacterium]